MKEQLLSYQEMGCVARMISRDQKAGSISQYQSREQNLSTCTISTLLANKVLVVVVDLNQQTEFRGLGGRIGPVLKRC
jgi:hypothetical protein